MAKPEAITLPADCPVRIALKKSPKNNTCAKCPYTIHDLAEYCPFIVGSDAEDKIEEGRAKLIERSKRKRKKANAQHHNNKR